MDLKELNYIVTIANEKSVSRAAKKLYMAQSSLSQSLQNYEAELGTTLFVRTSRGVRMTSAGEIFIRHAKQILNQYHLAKSEVQDIEGLVGGTVKMGISTFRGSYILPPVLKHFYKIYPRVQVEVTEMDSIDLENQLAEGLLDIALIATPPIRLKIEPEFLMNDEIVLIATNDHPIMKLAHPCPDTSDQMWVNLYDTAPFEYILGPPDTILGRIARSELCKCGVEPLGENTEVSASLAAAMARAGLGLALTYSSCRVFEKNVRYLRIGENGAFLELALAYPVGAYRSCATSALAEMLHKTYTPGCSYNNLRKL